MGVELYLKLVRNQYVHNQFLPTYTWSLGISTGSQGGTVRLVCIYLKLTKPEVWKGC